MIDSLVRRVIVSLPSVTDDGLGGEPSDKPTSGKFKEEEELESLMKRQKRNGQLFNQIRAWLVQFVKIRKALPSASDRVITQKLLKGLISHFEEVGATAPKSTWTKIPQGEFSVLHG
jgi:hypothetical protein